MNNNRFRQLMLQADQRVDELFGDFDRRFNGYRNDMLARQAGMVDIINQIMAQEPPVPAVETEAMPIMPDIGEPPMPAMPEIELGEEYPNG